MIPQNIEIVHMGLLHCMQQLHSITGTLEATMFIYYFRIHNWLNVGSCLATVLKILNLAAT